MAMGSAGDMALKKAWGDLRTRKLRTALVVFSVAVAAFGVSAIKILGDQFERTTADKYAGSNPPDLTVETLPLAAAGRAALRDVDNVQRVEGRLAGTARWRPGGGERKENLAIQGVADFQDEQALDRVHVGRGSAPRRGEIVFEKGARQKYGVAVGQEVTLVGVDGEQTYTVSGLGENPNVTAAAVVGFASAWLNHEDAAKLLGVSDDKDNRLLIALRDNRSAALRDYTQQRVRDTLAGGEATILGSQVRDPTTMPGRDMLDALHTILLVFGLFGAFASGLLVVNTVSTIVLEQRPQIGAMKAIGGTTGDVMAMYLVLSLLYGVLGTALGLLAGIAFAAMSEGARATALDEPQGALSLSVEAVALVLAIGVGSCLLAALLPTWAGARVTVREALSSYGLGANFGRGAWDRLVLRYHGLPPAALLALRNVFRQPQRALLTLGGLAVATIILLAVIATLGALSRSLHAAGDAVRADLLFSFDAPAEGPAIDRALADTAGIERRELWLVSSAKIGGKTVSLTGLPPTTTIFDTDTVRAGGRWLQESRNHEAVVTQRLASRQGLAVGSTIELASGSRPSREWTVVGIVPGAGSDVMAPDGAVYGTYEGVRALVDYPENRGNQLYVRLADRGRENVDARARTLSDTLADAELSNIPVLLYEQQQNTERIFAGFVLLFGLMLMIVALVGALGLFGTLTMNVMERRREIGVIRSVGAPTRTLLGTFLLEGLLLGLIGWALGVVLGAPASRLLVGYFSDTLIPLEYRFPAGGVVLTALATLLVALAASVGPALLATRIRIAEILRYA
jgi:putative ABC transport system permease protein